MSRTSDILITASAPLIWGSTYIVATELLPADYPLTAAMLRALPAGLLLLLFSRQLPKGIWFIRSLVLGALNFSIFWWLLFVAAYRLPGGIAATAIAIIPLIVIFLSSIFLGQKIRLIAILSGLGGLLGVVFLVISPDAKLDHLGILAAFFAAVSMAFGIVLTRKWQPPVPLLTFTAWQLTFGGLILLPASMLLEPSLPTLTAANTIGFIYLGLIGGAATYFLWFRGITKLGPQTAAVLGLLSPVAAVVLGWALLNQALSPFQGVGAILVLVSVWYGQAAQQRSITN